MVPLSTRVGFPKRKSFNYSDEPSWWIVPSEWYVRLPVGDSV